MKKVSETWAALNIEEKQVINSNIFKLQGYLEKAITINSERDIDDIRSKQALKQERVDIESLINKTKLTLNPDLKPADLLEEEKMPRPPAAKKRKGNNGEEIPVSQAGAMLS